ncbi:heme o synthase [Oikeobacillus pervagus]|nr:heme o synthase [Oikeobacillus pervagus]
MQNASTVISKEPLSQIVSETIKTGIIKSNLIAMFAGLALALYSNEIHPFQKLPEILFAMIGSILTIGAAGVFNNVYDRDIDSIMNRTKNRPTVKGTIQFKKAILLGVFMTLFGLMTLALASPLAALFGFLGLFFYVVPYTMWSKRRTIYNTEIGSISGATPPLIGWASITPDMTHPGLLGLFAVIVLWQMPHFYAIAIRNHDEYKAAGVPMLPVIKGFKRTFIQTNVYLVALIVVSFLFTSISLFIAIVAFVLSVVWLILSVFRYKKMSPEIWAKWMFIFSLNYITILFGTIIVYCLIGSIF